MLGDPKSPSQQKRNPQGPDTLLQGKNTTLVSGSPSSKPGRSACWRKTHSFNKQQQHGLTVEKEPSPRIFPNLKSSGRFFRGCGGGCAACCSELALVGDSAAVLSMVVGPCLLPPLGTTGAVPDSVWVLTIDGDGQEHNTTLD